jgi:nucleotide-binding universal stress UspA family protein
VIKNILVTVDGSESSTKALDFAADMADKYSAALTVLNISQASATVGVMPQQIMDYSGSGMIVMPNIFREIHNEILNKAVEHAKTAKPNLTIIPKLVEGDPASQIVATAKNDGFDVVVIGHKGAGRVKEMFLGSVSEKVAHLAPCPVIIVR